MKALKKVFISFLLGVLVFVNLVSPITVRAQDVGPWYNQEFGQWMRRVYDESNPGEIFGERYTAAQVQWVIYGFIGFLLRSSLGEDITNCVTGNGPAMEPARSSDPGTCLREIFTDLQEQFGYDSSSSKDKGLVAQVFEERPLSLVGYVKDVGRRLDIVPEAYAQQQPGFGFQGLGIIRTMWQATRDISYALFILVIVVAAFMIMFRVKLSPQTVVTLQSSLPKIVVALILVTFSYAIAGLLVDLMYVVIGIISIFLSSFTDTAAGSYFNDLTLGPEIAGWRGGIFGFILIFLVQFTATLASVLVGRPDTLLGSGVAILAGIGSGVIAFVALILLVVFLIMAVIAIFKSFMALIKAFINVIFLVVLAPLQFTLGVVYPGIGFGTWLKSFVSNLAVFPVAGVMFMFAFILLNLAIDAGGLGGLHFLYAIDVGGEWTLANGWPPLLGLSGGVMGVILAIGALTIVTTIPRVAELINSLISGRPFSIGAGGMGEFALGAGLGYISSVESRKWVAMEEARQKAIAAGQKNIPEPPRWRRAGHTLLDTLGGTGLIKRR